MGREGSEIGTETTRFSSVGTRTKPQPTVQLRSEKLSPERESIFNAATEQAFNLARFCRDNDIVGFEVGVGVEGAKKGRVVSITSVE